MWEHELSGCRSFMLGDSCFECRRVRSNCAVRNAGDTEVSRAASCMDEQATAHGRKETCIGILGHVLAESDGNAGVVCPATSAAGSAANWLLPRPPQLHAQALVVQWSGSFVRQLRPSQAAAYPDTLLLIPHRQRRLVELQLVLPGLVLRKVKSSPPELCLRRL